MCPVESSPSILFPARRQRDVSLTLALCLSLVAHALLFFWLVQTEMKLLRSERADLRRPIDPAHLEHRVKAKPELDPFTLLPPPPPEAPLIAPVTPSLPAPPEEQLSDSEFGESTGKGNA